MIINGIQVARGLAALAVVGCHALPNFAVGAAGVDLFFVISGFVMVHSSDRLFGRTGAVREFLQRRIIRVVPLYWAMTTVLLVHLLVRYRGLEHTNLSIEAVVASYLFIPFPKVDGTISPVHIVGWTLNFEMFFYVCFAASLFFSKRIGVLILSAALCVFVQWKPTSPQALSYLADPLILEFVSGMMIALVVSSGFRIPFIVFLAAVALSVTALLCSSFWTDVSRFIAWGLPASIIIAAIALMKDHKSVPRSLLLLGDASYALYITHTLTIIIPQHVEFFSNLQISYPCLYGIAMVILAIAVAVIVHLFCEKPVLQLLRRLTSDNPHYVGRHDSRLHGNPA